MTIRNIHNIALVSAAICSLALTGCLERKESITVRPDLSVQIDIEYSGTREDLAGPDAMPSEATGWRIERSVTKGGDEEKHVVKATADFAAEAELPGSYSKVPGPFLQFPTELRKETRDGDELIHFRRVYLPRPFARFDYWNDRFINDEIKKTAEKPAESMTVAERVQLITAFAKVEAHKRVEIAGAAVATSVPTVKQDAWLLARRAALDVFENIDIEKLANDIDGLDESARDQKIAALGETVPADAVRAFVETLRSAAKLDSNAVDQLQTALATEDLRYRVTQSTRSHGFQIVLRLPGEILAHNGDRVVDGAVIWEFDGKAFSDREFDLLATCRSHRH